VNFHPSHALDIFTKKQPEGKLILTGNEAYARGLFEANVQFLSMYPGTPISEIGDIWEKYANTIDDVFYDLSINETVAFEAAVGASWSGIRAAVAFKHLGMNLVADALHSVMYSGIDGKRKAGLVVICGGDPEISSSTNAMDVRLFSLHSKIPILEPSTIQECKDFIKFAFELSEAINLPVMVFSPSRINHASGIVKCIDSTPIYKPTEDRYFIKNFDKYLNAIHWARKNQTTLIEIITKLQYHPPVISTNYSDIFGDDTETLKLITPDNKNPPVKVGIITSGISLNYIKEVLTSLGKELPILRLKITYPILIPVLLKFVHLNKPDYLIIIEEQESFLELNIKNILYDHKIAIPIIGKSIFPVIGGLSPDILIEKLSKKFVEFASILPNNNSKIDEIKQNLPIREPTFCPGCSHRNVFYSLRKAAENYRSINNIEPIYGGDIGCYTLSMSEPFSTMDWLICMGAGVGIANGVARVVDPKKNHVIAIIGDSTFFHTGIQAVYNLAKNNADVTVLILNNYYTAMTGHQLSPATPRNLLEYEQKIRKSPNEIQSFSIQNLLKSVGDYPIHLMDGYSNKKMIKQFGKIFKERGLKFVLVNAECALNKRRRIKKQRITIKDGKFPHTIAQIQEHCSKCNECFEILGCSAIQMVDGSYQIDETRCMGENCLSCLELCPNHAIYKTEMNPHLKK
jgi:indolepyruvate ferredoxin oxidoreductase, alpha subunit